MSTAQITVNQAAARYGVTLRQLEHWMSRGYLQVQRRGYGHQRLLDRDDACTVYAMRYLLDAGLRLEHAAQYARLAVEHDTGTIPLPAGGTITIPNPKDHA